jgi:uncharacterized protein (DUF2236 family)
MTDVGLFGPGSVAWRLHSDPVMLAGGMRALLVQALNPRAMAAVDQFGKFREDPWGRLERTSNFVLATTFGDIASAEAAAARVRGVHSRIFGVDPFTGETYSATDPDLLLWIHAVEVESFVVAYRAYAGHLSRADADRYVAEMARVAEMVELPAAMAPRSMGELHDYLGSITGLAVTPAARDGLRTVLAPPMPLLLRPAWAIPATAAIAILPGYARRMYGIPWFPPATIPVRAGVFGLSRVLIRVRPRHPMVREARARVQGPSAAA